MAFPEKPKHECVTVNVKLCDDTKQTVLNEQADHELNKGTRIGKEQAIKNILRKYEKLKSTK